MTARRGRGEGGLHWDESRQRWIATAALGFDARGKRITRKASGTTKTAAKTKLREILRDHADGLTVTSAPTPSRTPFATGSPTAWPGAPPRPSRTTPPSPKPGSSPHWAADGCVTCPPRTSTAGSAAQATEVSTRTLRLMHSILNRAVVRAMARNKVQRNVVALCSVPGRAGRPPVEVAHPCPGRRPARRRRGHTIARLRRALPADRRPDRGSARAALGTRRPRRQPATALPRSPRRSPCCARSGKAATPRPASRDGASRSPRRCVDALTAHRASLGHVPDGRGAGLRHPQRNRAGRAQRPPRLPPHRRRRRPGPDRLDTTGAAAQLRVPALRRGRRGNRLPRCWRGRRGPLLPIGRRW